MQLPRPFAKSKTDYGKQNGNSRVKKTVVKPSHGGNAKSGWPQNGAIMNGAIMNGAIMSSATRNLGRWSDLNLGLKRAIKGPVIAATRFVAAPWRGAAPTIRSGLIPTA
jgi:hypothetical protein